jgi:hypothetical protein
MSPGEQTFYGKTLEDALAWSLVSLMPLTPTVPRAK